MCDDAPVPLCDEGVVDIAANDAPMVTQNGPGAVNAGDTVTYTYTAVDLEPDLDGGISYTASQTVNVAKAEKK